MFAIALIPMVGLIGASIDYSRANSVKSAMQASLDATALQLSKTAATLTTSQIQTSAVNQFNALFTRPEATGVTITSAFTSSTSTLVLTAAASVKTNFMGVLGISNMNVGISSTVKWGGTRLRVALVLDTTGSMGSDGKIAALKTATNNLLDKLKATVSVPEDVYVSIIPFSRDVNAGASNYNAAWIDWSDWEAPPDNSTPSSNVGPGSSCPWSDNSSGYHCQANPTNDSTDVVTIPSSGTYAGYICPTMDNGNKNALRLGRYYNGCYTSVASTTTSTNTVSSGWGASCSGYSNCTCTGSNGSKVCKQTVTTTGAPYTHTWIPNAHSTWTGCVVDRGDDGAPNAQNYDQKTTAPAAGTIATLYTADQYQYCSPQIMGLSNDWTSMKTLVNNLYPNGSTNQPIGLVWGWLSLAGVTPMTAPVKDPNYPYADVIILMSDGLNTQDRWYGNGSSTSTSVDKRMYDLTNGGAGTCFNAKSAGATIYTVQVNTDNDPTSTLLQNCATDSSKFLVVTSANQLVTTFDQIGTQLVKLRIAK